MYAKLRWIVPALSLLAWYPVQVAAADTTPGTRKILVLPAYVKVYSLTASGSVEDSPDATAAASGYGNAELQRYLATDAAFKLVPMPTLSASEQSTLDEHVALYKSIVHDARMADSLGGPWKAPLAAFTYSVGPGLDFVRQRSGADYLLVLVAEDGESTAGRIAMTMLFGGLVGRNYISAGLIDLHTGNVVWLNYDTHNAKDFVVQANMTQFVDDILQDYPEGSLHDAASADPASH